MTGINATASQLEVAESLFDVYTTINVKSRCAGRLK